ncbi:purine nucleoside phosphorylase [Caballeronia sordidicola]|uniref:Purine nucleoside phosphorylase n=1 Tax=Caballeronia sordidicola TaxID=196367 RepID=A0A158GVM1_CABSO|nr:DUF4148 domain-containing protein [Caballeronia sordidicola]SAL35841.1 purine nucleoside phosphorylase [Caballeronia sordidicola]
MFKSLIPAVVIVSALAAPTFAFAQTSDNNGPVTRAEVKAQLVQLEKAGYNPAGDQINYPANIQAAQARVDAQNQAATSYGPSTSGTSAAGVRGSAPVQNAPGSVFFGH